MNDPEPSREEEIRPMLRTVQRRLRKLTVAVVLMTLALALLAATVYGSLVNWFDGQATLYGGTLIGAALLGFAFGWFARSRR